MTDNGQDVLEQMQAYRRVVELYEALDEEIDALIMRYDGATENMPEEEFHHYRQLAERRDEAYNQMLELEQNLQLDDDSVTE
jgi:hypothetical protein